MGPTQGVQPAAKVTPTAKLPVQLGSSVMLLAVGILLISNYLSVISAYLIFWTGYTGI